MPDKPSDSPKQAWLLSDSALREANYSAFQNRQPDLQLSADALQAWKQRIYRYQQQLQAAPAVEQGSLFGDSGCDASGFDLSNLNPSASPESDETAIVDHLNPFSLPQQNTEFWKWRADDQGAAALYFVIDYEFPILLYVGETVKANQRWKGVHDCKRYLFNYVSAHRPHDLPTSVNIGFWPHAPAETRPRQRLESNLIYKWRSPFNKENWKFWSTPFVGE